MIAVFIGENSEGNFRKTICSQLKKHVSPIEISPQKITFNSDTNSNVCCIFSENPQTIDSPCSVIFLNNCKKFPQITGKCCCVFDSSNTTDFKTAQNSGSTVYSCGFSTRDTLTFSSNFDENCVISLQRTIKRPDNSIAEPFELPIKCNKNDDKYGILCAYLLLILLGKI